MTVLRDFSKKQGRADYVAERLAELYPKTPIPLDHRDAYTLLVAVVLSAQSTDVSVNKVTSHLWARVATPAEMAQVPVEEIRQLIRSVGLARKKSKAIRELSQLLVERHGGAVPRTFAKLEALPGVGHKAASVVMSQAFGFPAFPVDTHIHRLAQRWKLSKGRIVEKTETDLKRLFPEEDWSQLHLRMIYYGREYCTARGCNGTACEICSTLFPERKPVVKMKKRNRVDLGGAVF